MLMEMQNYVKSIKFNCSEKIDTNFPHILKLVLSLKNFVYSDPLGLLSNTIKVLEHYCSIHYWKVISIENNNNWGLQIMFT